MSDLRDILRQCGIEKAMCWGDSSGIQNIKEAGHAAVTIVLSVSGIHAAQILKERFGIPYITGFPVGRKALEEYTFKIKSVLNPAMEKINFSINQAKRENTFERISHIPSVELNFYYFNIIYTNVLEFSRSVNI
ncbi:nitrogenase component 1 [Tissierella praeacuta]|uniref:nitrogenase component 1 n=1 Tax=Tissierella praeacuta TaxID=43131 RepID=UPI0033410A26